MGEGAASACAPGVLHTPGKSAPRACAAGSLCCTAKPSRLPGPAQSTEALRAAHGLIGAGALLVFALQRDDVVLQLQQS